MRFTAPSLMIAPALLAIGASGCISTDSKVLDATEGCDELEQGTVESLELDADAEDFVLASEELTISIESLNDDVFNACAGIATDLGADDTWSEHESFEQRISNDDDTGACDVALIEIDKWLTTAAEADIDVQVALAKGECRLEMDSQAACDEECAMNTSCEPGSIEARCEPGSITSICDGSCAAGAFCVGTAEVEANCEGRCEGMCLGACKGKCHKKNGEITEDDAECEGFCTEACAGKCSGKCEVEVEAGLACGAGVYCRGTCDGVMESPACITEFEEPQCEVDTTCYEACTARLAAEATCTPTEVQVITDVSLMPDLEPVVATLDEHLPVLVAAAEAEGKLVQAAGKRMADAGDELNDRIDDLDGKSLACVGAASTKLADAVETISVSVEACLAIQTELEVDVNAEGS